ncbi:sugar transferase [Carboxylicivirga taeanensis]|uniref:sugar transferase n=1 Tax=Carboxylicivirga taeanensis TaxID=1416875 RepID=UPI003F6DE5E7
MQLAQLDIYNYNEEISKRIAKSEPQLQTTPYKWALTAAAIKRCCDIAVSLVGLLLILPFVPLIYWKIKKDSAGPFIYRQERIGKGGRKFIILKFRTMYMDAEKDGPALSSQNDARVTPFGRFLRKWRLDEFPQFWNVLKGDMSVIGPRPERQYYIEQLAKDEPCFNELLNVKPGITSLGQVLYGYAENKTEMLRRIKLELFYTRNYSMSLDLRVFVYTLRTLIKAEGK